MDSPSDREGQSKARGQTIRGGTLRALRRRFPHARQTRRCEARILQVSERRSPRRNPHPRQWKGPARVSAASRLAAAFAPALMRARYSFRSKGVSLRVISAVELVDCPFEGLKSRRGLNCMAVSLPQSHGPAWALGIEGRFSPTRALRDRPSQPVSCACSEFVWHKRSADCWKCMDGRQRLLLMQEI